MHAKVHFYFEMRVEKGKSDFKKEKMVLFIGDS